MKRPGDKDSQQDDHAAERLREFLRQRLGAGASPDEIQKEIERLANAETEGSETQKAADETSPPIQQADPPS
jgi:hypothetical protein